MDGGCLPIVIVPRDISFESTPGCHAGSLERNATTDDNDGNSSGYPLYLSEDWDSGIGGGLWTTGLALGRYFATSPHFLEEFRSLRSSKTKHTHNQQQQQQHEQQFTSHVATTALNTANAPTNNRQPPIRVLELGSGNGFLGVCLVTAVAVAEANSLDKKRTDNNSNSKINSNTDNTSEDAIDVGFDFDCWRPGIEVVVTDTAEHLPLMRATIESNLKRILPQIIRNHKANTTDIDIDTYIDVERIARVEEYLWGEEYNFGGGRTSNRSGDKISGHQQSKSFDLIIGSDVAYRDHLHDPLIAALDEFCVPQHTVALIGVTMSDTKPIFFEKLTERGFCYEKLADHLLGDEFCTSNRQFGVFSISKR
jgi:predicted nicotinamide N-methyase